jgi:hypothetical protein
MNKLRHPQVQTLLKTFKHAGLLFEVWQIIDDSNPYGYSGEDLIISCHGERNGFIFQDEDGGRLLRTAPPENPSQKRRELAVHPLRNENDAWIIVTKYNLIMGGPLAINETRIQALADIID